MFLRFINRKTECIMKFTYGIFGNSIYIKSWICPSASQSASQPDELAVRCQKYWSSQKTFTTLCFLAYSGVYKLCEAGRWSHLPRWCQPDKPTEVYMGSHVPDSWGVAGPISQRFSWHVTVEPQAWSHLKHWENPLWVPGLHRMSSRLWTPF